MPQASPIVSRFAPSPTGFLHLGHLVNAIYVWGITRALGGQVILRVEDHDRGRCRPEYEQAILDDLDWLGLVPDRGTAPEFRAGPTAYRQSDSDGFYQAALRQLHARGLLYTCTCSRKEILARTGNQTGELRYDAHCRSHGYLPEAPGGTRLRMERIEYVMEDLRLGPLRQCPADQCGDLLLQDRHGNWTYQFAVVVDDIRHGVNLVVRGEDLVDSTARQCQLAELLGRAAPPAFLHHPLITDPDGKKFSKRDFAKGLRDYRAEGRTPECLLGEAAWRVGLTVRPGTLGAADLPALFERDTMLPAIASFLKP